MTKKYKINGVEISPIISTEINPAYSTINKLLEALADKEEDNYTPEQLKEASLAETRAEIKEKYESGWENQSNWKHLHCSMLPLSLLSNSEKPFYKKQEYIAKINTVIDAINKEQEWVEDWENNNQYKHYIQYNNVDKTLYVNFTLSVKVPSIINYSCERAVQFIFYGYKEELKVIMDIK